ncbi:MAG: EAL domain-containing protein [Pseudomonadota bacterium]
MTLPPDLFHLAFESTSAALVVCNAEARCVAANVAGATLLGVEVDNLLGVSLEALLGPVPTGTVEWEVQREHPDGNSAWLVCRISPPLGDGKHFVVTLSDISEQKRYKQELLRCTTWDPATGLPSRIPFLERLTQAIAYAVRNQQPLAVLLLDIDRFLHIGATFGLAATESLLRAVAERLHAAVRREDSLAAIGADQLAILLQPTPDESVSTAAQRLLDLLAAPLRVGEMEFVLTACVGVALHPADGTEAKDLLKHATEAMLAAKQRGPGCIQFFTVEMNTRAARHLELSRYLRNVLASGELALEYLPLVSMTTGKVMTVEALLRWHSEALGMVPPDEFLPLVEDSGAIIAIDDWVLAAACHQVRTWQDEGLPEVHVAVNLSARSFRDPQLTQRVSRVLAQSGLAAEWLELELAERVLMANTEESARILVSLKTLGVRLAMDDFGTDLSSLSFLSHIPIDFLKIDRSLIRNITKIPVNSMAINSIIAMAQTLGMRVVAEGVETDAQLSCLSDKGCDFMQGYYFSRPAPVEDIARLLAEGRQLEMTRRDSGEEHTLLLVDDDSNVLSALNRVLRREGYRLLMACSAEEGLELLALNKVQVIVSDQRMPTMSGIEFLGRVKELYPDTVRMVLSGYTDFQTVTEAINKGAIYHFLAKPWEDETLKEYIRTAFRHYHARGAEQ